MQRATVLLAFIPLAVASCKDLTCMARPCVENSECANLSDSCHTARCTAPKGDQKFGHCVLDVTDGGADAGCPGPAGH